MVINAAEQSFNTTLPLLMLTLYKVQTVHDFSGTEIECLKIAYLVFPKSLIAKLLFHVASGWGSLSDKDWCGL